MGAVKEASLPNFEQRRREDRLTATSTATLTRSMFVVGKRGVCVRCKERTNNRLDTLWTVDEMCD